MINVFDCSSLENYLYEILEYSLNAKEISVDARVNSFSLVVTTILNREARIEIIYPEKSDIQFGYKLANAAIDSLKNQGIENIASSDFIRLRSVYKSLIRDFLKINSSKRIR